VKILVKLLVAFGLTNTGAVASPAHNLQFWRSIRAHDFAVPAGESVDRLALEIVDLAAESDPVLRDECGYEILADWVYKRNLIPAETLETIRQKLVTGMMFHLGESDNPSVFRRSFSALYVSILAAHDLHKPFLSETAFRETLDAALKCYAEERDLRGYIPSNGWAHATAHVADLLKFLGRNPQLKIADQSRVVAAIKQRCRTTPSVFVWGEDARIAAALSSLVARKDFDALSFDAWFKALVADNKELWKASPLDPVAYLQVRTQGNVLTHLAARIAAIHSEEFPMSFRSALNATVTDLN
jgi:hypothetical protein